MPTKEAENSTIETSPITNKSNNKKIILLIGIALTICACITCAIVTAIVLIGRAGVSTSEYIQKTETNFTASNGYVVDVKNSIENDFSTQSENLDLNEYTNRLNKANLAAKTLENQVNTYLTSIPNTNSETKNLDILLRDYYSAAKDLGSSYQALTKSFSDFTPLNDDFKKASEDLTNMVSEGEPTTEQAYHTLTVNINKVITNLKKDQPILNSINTIAETNYLKTNTSKLLDATIKYLENFVVFTGKMETLVEGSNTEAIDAASTNFLSAQTEFQATTSEATSDSKAQKESLVEKYQSKAKTVLEKQKSVEIELLRLKSLQK